MVAYHITEKKNLIKIMGEGLIPRIGDRSQSLGEEKELVYLFPDLDSVEDALMNWLGDEFGEDTVLVVLEVNLKGLKYTREESQFEITCEEKISPDRITVLREE